MQFVFHASAHAVKGANKAQDPRGVNGHSEGSTDESGRCGTTLSFVLFFWSFTTPLSFRTAIGSCSHCTNSSLSFKSILVRPSAFIKKVGIQWYWSGAKHSCIARMFTRLRFSVVVGASLITQSYKDLASVACAYGSLQPTWCAGSLNKISDRNIFTKANRSAASSPADASAASVERHTLCDFADFQSMTEKGAPKAFASEVVAPMITPS